MNRNIVQAVVAAVAVIVPASAIAQPPVTIVPPGSFRTVISHKDLDLRSARDITLLKTRISSAARSGCDELAAGEPRLRTYAARSNCFRASVADAMTQVDRVTQLARAGSLTGTDIVIALRR